MKGTRSARAEIFITLYTWLSCCSRRSTATRCRDLLYCCSVTSSTGLAPVRHSTLSSASCTLIESWHRMRKYLHGDGQAQLAQQQPVLSIQQFATTSVKLINTCFIVLCQVRISSLQTISWPLPARRAAHGHGKRYTAIAVLYSHLFDTVKATPHLVKNVYTCIQFVHLQESSVLNMCPIPALCVLR